MTTPVGPELKRLSRLLAELIAALQLYPQRDPFFATILRRRAEALLPILEALDASNASPSDLRTLESDLRSAIALTAAPLTLSLDVNTTVGALLGRLEQLVPSSERIHSLPIAPDDDFGLRDWPKIDIGDSVFVAPTKKPPGPEQRESSQRTFATDKRPGTDVLQSNRRRKTARPGPARYANAALFPQRGKRALTKRDGPLPPNRVFRLRLDIGKLVRGVHVGRRPQFPERNLPKNVNLDVMVSSSDFGVRRASSSEPLEGGSIAHGRFFLPADGRPAIAPDRTRFLWFELLSPARSRIARCRIGYYFRDVLVQSQILKVGVGKGPRLQITTDFTLSTDLRGMEVIPVRPRVSLLANSNGSQAHQFVLRSSQGKEGTLRAGTVAIRDQPVSKTLEAIRSRLAERAPRSLKRTRAELEEDLRVLAPLGWDLYTQLVASLIHPLQTLYDDPEHTVLQVLRPASSAFVLPWSLIYEIPLPDPAGYILCPSVRTWTGAEKLFDGEPRRCPHGRHEEGVLCPFGFWGFRYTIEQLSSTDRPDLELQFPSDGDVVVAKTLAGIDAAALADHVGALRSTLSGAFPDSRLQEARSKSEVRAALGQDLSIVYFYCHGKRRSDVDPDTWLEVGRGETVSAKEFVGWVATWSQSDKKVIWDKVRPLVFINACHSLAIQPITSVSYLDAFVSSAHAVGVIGTEVRVDQGLAMQVGQRFFQLFVQDVETVESALRTIRLEYLANGNMVGLTYTPYCWSDLKIVRT